MFKNSPEIPLVSPIPSGGGGKSINVISAGVVRLGLNRFDKVNKRLSGTLATPIFELFANQSTIAEPAVTALNMVVFPLLGRPIMPTSIALIIP